MTSGVLREALHLKHLAERLLKHDLLSRSNPQSRLLDPNLIGLSLGSSTTCLVAILCVESLFKSKQEPR